MANPALETKVIIRDVQLSYAYLVTPKEQDGNKKWSAMILIKKDRADLVAQVKKAINNAYRNGVEKTWRGKEPSKVGFRQPLRDGDLERADDPNCRGCWFINASSSTEPGFIDKARHDMRSPEYAALAHSGMVCHVSVNFFSYSNSGNNGIGCGINNVLYVSEGEYFGGRTTAENDFGADLDPDDFSEPQTDAAGDPYGGII